MTARAGGLGHRGGLGMGGDRSVGAALAGEGFVVMILSVLLDRQGVTARVYQR